MIYKFDPKTLQFRKNPKVIYYVIASGFVFALMMFIMGRYIGINNLTNYEKELVVLNLEKERNKFTEGKLIELIKELNIRFPHIVLAQAKLESGNYKSKIFIESNNLFGMKQAKVRINTAKGTQFNHAYYDTWKESVYDYAFYSCRYLHNIKTEEEYYATLNASYAEAGTSYSKALKQIVEKENLKKIF
jgi:uncharacterized FlgJ-related protein